MRRFTILSLLIIPLLTSAISQFPRFLSPKESVAYHFRDSSQSRSEVLCPRSEVRELVPGRRSTSDFGPRTSDRVSTCNRPVSDMPPAPDGCPHYTPIAPPATPIPPPCVAETRVERWTEDGTPVTELSIHVHHPEIGPGTRTYTKLVRYHAANPKSEWELVDLDWEVSCGKDEGPLTWATLQVLNGHAAAGLAIYQPPLPHWYAALLVELSGPSHLYLPIIIQNAK